MTRKKQNDPEVPREFPKLGESLYQGFDDEIHTTEALIDYLAGRFSKEEAAALQTFLGTIVESVSAEELLRMWNRAVTDYYFSDGEEVRRMFALVRDRLGQGRMRPGWQPVGEGRNHGRLVQAPNGPKRR